MNSKQLWCAAASLAICVVSADQVERSVFSCNRSWFEKMDPALTAKDKTAGTIRRAGWTEYDFEIREPGWHELAIYGGGNQPKIWLDGEYVVNNIAGEQLDSYGRSGRKMKNVYLTAGSHMLKIQSTRFPASQPAKWTLIGAKDRNGMIRAEFVGDNITRLHEPVRISITAGAPDRELAYEIVGTRIGSNETVSLARVVFRKGLSSKELNLRFPSEGIWLLRLRQDGKLSRPADLGLGRVVLIDTRAGAAVSGKKQQLLHDIDCVKLTDSGHRLSLNNGFWEAFGKTRITNSSAGTYRESSDNLEPGIRMVKGIKSKSGFSFDISVPEEQKPYLLELEYPDDDRRTVNVIILNEGDPKVYGQAQLGSGYETGDYYPLTGKMLKHRVLFWPNSKRVTVAVMSMNPVMRSAASKIRVWSLSGVPGGFESRKDGRIMAVWNEEPRRWVAAMQSHSANRNGGGEMGRDFLALDRMAAMCRYAGYNAISPTEAVYQSPTWNSEELAGWFSLPYNATRMAALFCEKYGLRYIPELHLSAQRFFTNHFPKTVKKPDDLYIYSRLGNHGGPDIVQGWTSPLWNALHPDVQNKYIAVIQELMDSIGDSPAFAGVSSRMMTWVGTSWAYLPSLNWGYGDWTAGEFTRDTGIKVPGRKDDPERFDQRFRFLTSEKMLPVWKKWRRDRIMAFLMRIRDTVRRKNPAAVLYLPYFGSSLQGMDGPFGTLNATNIREAFEETGIDADALKKTDGICLIGSSGGTGRRYSTMLNDFRLHSLTNDPLTLSLGQGAGIGGQYFEDHEKIPIDLLGFLDRKPGGYCGGAEPGGLLRLENYAIPLAEGDSQIIRFGGLAYVYGQPDVMHEWLREYENLPAETFTKFTKAVDPVAVWFRKGESNFFRRSKYFCFYAVNRLPAPVKITIKLKGAEELRSVADGAKTVLKDGTIKLELKPYGLRAFYAAPCAQLADAVTAVPDSVKQTWRTMLESTAKLRELAAVACTSKEKAYLTVQLDKAWDAFQRGEYWNSKGALVAYDMIRLYEKLGFWPSEIIHRKGGIGKLSALPEMRNVTPQIPLMEGDTLVETSKVPLKMIPSETVNPDWRFEKLYVPADGRMKFEIPVPAPGRYTLHVGLASPNRSAAIISANGTTAVMQLARKGLADKIILPPLVVRSGRIAVEIISPDSKLGIYAMRLDPVRTPIPSPKWLTIGPFRYVDCNYDKAGLMENLTKDWGPEADPNPAREYRDATGKPLKWLYSDKIEGRGIEYINIEAGTSFLLRNKVNGMGLCYALTFITSPENRDAVIEFSCDWWANLYLNGKKVTVPGGKPESGAEFSSWMIRNPVKVRLKKGVNTLLVKVNGGTMSTSFCCWISDPGDLKISPENKTGK